MKNPFTDCKNGPKATNGDSHGRIIKDSVSDFSNSL
jgi:hypothetical protein